MNVELPGLFDLQVNGFGGIDFNAPGLSAGRVDEALDLMRATGVTRCLPTLITSSFDQFARNARVIAHLAARAGDPAVAGIHMEGPYISPEDGARGAHPRAHVMPALVDDFARRQDAADGRIVLVTLAPEVAGAVALIEHLVASGVRGDRPHRGDAAADRCRGRAGATLSTHLGNGCAQRCHGIRTSSGSSLPPTADGEPDRRRPSSAPATVKAMVRAKGARRTMLVTDAIAAAGCAPGRYTIGGVACDLGEDGRVSLPGTPYLAGSSLTMDHAIANTVRFTGLPLDEVIPMASTIPASFLGMAPAGRVRAEWDAERQTLRILGASA
jgi:N-acetylglucosamine-6-phosphate deacetylase